MNVRAGLVPLQRSLDFNVLPAASGTFLPGDRSTSGQLFFGVNHDWFATRVIGKGTNRLKP